MFLAEQSDHGIRIESRIGAVYGAGFSITPKINLQMVERFGRWLVAQKYFASTQERYCRIARELCDHIDTKAMSAVTPMDIGDFLTKTLPNRWADNYITDRLGARSDASSTSCIWVVLD